ncbi:hypothetical protein CP532_1610 [Ophiocordyceps camponoti-leonardi (nom. inval.)]|nr:hypothetical protein CP532_1610 [Ophiocordyceps camponoti-leonardi (nom. inval.)]
MAVESTHQASASVSNREPADKEANDIVAASDEAEGQAAADAGADALVNLTIALPDADSQKIQLMVSSQEQVHEVRQSIIELPSAFQHTCFHLEYLGCKVNDFIPIAEIPGITSNPEFQLVRDPYTEKEARIHLVRVRELIGAAGDRADISQGILPGLSLFESLSTNTEPGMDQLPVKNYDFQATPSLTSLIPAPMSLPPKTVKSIALSPWNPPPCSFRQRGHLLYILITTNEGEQFQITSHVSGFFVNKSSNTKFDPYPRPAPKGQSAHSLLELLYLLSPSFSENFTQLQEHNNQRDPLAIFQVTNALPAAPWAVPSPTSAQCAHVPDTTRPQEAFLLAGVENLDTLRDWNEEFQSAKELPRETVQDRVFRERLLSKLFADYNDAATKGAVMVARGELSPLNPTEGRDAQIFVYNNIFFSFGTDGVGTFTSEGGDEAARAATGKDVTGVMLVHQLDIDGLFTPATVVVDYLGRRIVGQSIVPGIFKQRDPNENQIDYGAVDGKEVVAADERFVSVFAQLSKALKVKKHPVWDKDGKRFDLETSVETKGLMGTDGRKYVLDLYRITPFDILWLEELNAEANGDDATRYPHRMTVLRPELVESFARFKMKQWVDGELARRGQAGGQGSTNGTHSEDEASTAGDKTSLDLADFKFALNPDAFSGQHPQTEEEKAQLESDEKEVREACQHLRDHAIPELLRELSQSEVSFPMDGQSLSRLLHKRGINIRYLGMVVTLATDKRLRCLREICIQDMVARAFKHVAAAYLRSVPLPLTAACMSHLLNCLLGHSLNPKPCAGVDESLRALYPDADLCFEAATPDKVRADIERQVRQRYRYALGSTWYMDVRGTQLLREICLRLGLQMLARDYIFGSPDKSSAQPTIGSEQSQPVEQTNGESKKKKKKARDGSPSSTTSATVNHTFVPDDIVDMVPVVKHSSPRSSLAEEALEAGRLSILQNQKKLGQELLLESLSLHEQIYGILHPEVAKVYNSLSMLYYQLDDKEAAIELARKAIVVAERTIGVDSAETLLNYLNLSLFLHQGGDSRGALVASKHALMLWRIIYGPDHPDSITTINNAAVMLQHLKEYHDSRLWFEESLRVCEAVFGKQSVNSATLLFQLAQALALDHDSKGAVNRMRESYNIFLNELGPEDKNTKEAESWLEQLTQNAVSIAKHAKDAQAKRIRSGIRFTAAAVPSQVSATRPSQHMGPASQIDSRSIDELIKFIEGGEQKSGSAKKRPGRGNPKRRGQSVAA